MEEKERQTLTESLKLLELEVEKDRSDLRTINFKLNDSYAYEDELIVRLNSARKATKELQLEQIDMYRHILERLYDMKKIMKVWTGNFFND